VSHSSEWIAAGAGVAGVGVGMIAGWIRHRVQVEVSRIRNEQLAEEMRALRKELRATNQRLWELARGRGAVVPFTKPPTETDA